MREKIVLTIHTSGCCISYELLSARTVACAREIDLSSGKHRALLPMARPNVKVTSVKMITGNTGRNHVFDFWGKM
jgi:hypothetical protein